MALTLTVSAGLVITGAFGALLGPALIGTEPKALAHTSLVSSDPAEGAQLSSSPAQVRLTFEEPVNAQFANVTVVGPDGSHWAKGPATANGTVLDVPVGELGPAGQYSIGYRVLSQDGHPVTGTVRFNLTQPGRGAQAPAPAPTQPPVNQQPEHGQHGAEHGHDHNQQAGLPAWAWTVAGIAAVLAALLVLIRLSRSARSQREKPQDKDD